MIMDWLKAYPQYLMPGHLLSRITHRLTRIETRWFKNALIRTLMRLFRIDLSEALISEVDGFRSFNAFFTRELQPGSRPVDADPLSVVSPVDGTISQIEHINQGTLLQAKGHSYSVAALLGCTPQQAQPFAQGVFTTIYLSPRDYHRIHIPVAGQLTHMTHIPGRLFSVNPATTRTIPGLFARNERVVSLFDTPVGSMAVVMVGAVNVGSIETVWAGEVTPPAGHGISTTHYPSETAPQFKKGDEIGRFNMGSTVIVLFSNPEVCWGSQLRPEIKVKMGERLGGTTRPA